MSEATQDPQHGLSKSEIKVAGAEYLVLRHVDYGDPSGWGWAEVKTVRAHSADQAIKKAAGETEDRFVAVPARSWNPRTVKVKTEKKITLK